MGPEPCCLPDKMTDGCDSTWPPSLGLIGNEFVAPSPVLEIVKLIQTCFQQNIVGNLHKGSKQCMYKSSYV